MLRSVCDLWVSGGLNCDLYVVYFCSGMEDRVYLLDVGLSCFE